MKKRNDLVSKGKYLALLLRHNPEKENLTMDKHGWVPISELTRGAFTRQELVEIVESNNKKRYGFNTLGTHIRALQGYSIPVDLGLEPERPPMYLYHGTPRKSVESIMNTGLNRGTRQYVHLSKDKETAIDVGKRRDGQPIILEINASSMWDDGHKFYISENGVWLADFIPAKYILPLH